MKTRVSFKSDRFKPYLSDDCQVNPGCLGAELSYWLSQQLAAKGVMTSYPEHEDWGWFIEYITDAGDEFWLCCRNISGTDSEWNVFLDPKRKSFFGLRKAETKSAHALIDALKEVLSESNEISDIDWYDEKQEGM